MNVKSLPKITGRMLMDYNVDRLSQLFVNADQQAVLDLYNQLLSTQVMVLSLQSGSRMV